jgi:transcription initiation factor TFIIIB Brf1 subunit/transcription initiation factor TFIIB
MELEHIEDIIEQLNIVPDFGFPLLQYEEEIKGWELMKDHISNNSKYERVNNFIDAQKYRIELENKQKFLNMSKEKKQQLEKAKKTKNLTMKEEELKNITRKIELKK